MLIELEIEKREEAWVENSEMFGRMAFICAVHYIYLYLP